MAALHARERSGVGQRIDGSLFETQVALLVNVGLSWLNLGIEAERWGTQHPSVVPYDAFKTSDLYFVCGATNDKQFAQLAKTLGRPDLSRDERFKTNPDRVTHREALAEILEQLFQQKTTAMWEQEFEGSGLPYATINTMERVFEHPQIAARNMIEEMQFDAAVNGAIKVIGMLGGHNGQTIASICILTTRIRSGHQVQQDPGINPIAASIAWRTYKRSVT